MNKGNGWNFGCLENDTIIILILRVFNLCNVLSLFSLIIIALSLARFDRKYYKYVWFLVFFALGDTLNANGITL